MWYNTWEVEREKFHLNFENGDIEENTTPVVLFWLPYAISILCRIKSITIENGFEEIENGTEKKEK